MFLPAVLSTAGNHPLRAYGILPAIMGIWGVGADAAWAWFARRLGRPGQWAGLALAAALLALLAMVAACASSAPADPSERQRANAQKQEALKDMLDKGQRN
jgi:apolipoprotein N-acyltransferase